MLRKFDGQGITVKADEFYMGKEDQENGHGKSGKVKARKIQLYLDNLKEDQD